MWLSADPPFRRSGSLPSADYESSLPAQGIMGSDLTDTGSSDHVCPDLGTYLATSSSLQPQKVSDSSIVRDLWPSVMFNFRHRRTMG